ncbi:hypothetical protein F2P81_025780 [Scophthalmus maximus]|uniref:Uncharacterized protein n=1 Tax=Scophthalmus maximus TaxID=52904 RepID=A0A6A4RNY0_SCOMX|nr:hypothetical protein F2P81_025780 [Scophthalmus maximus]
MNRGLVRSRDGSLIVPHPPETSRDTRRPWEPTHRDSSTRLRNNVSILKNSLLPNKELRASGGDAIPHY